MRLIIIGAVFACHIIYEESAEKLTPCDPAFFKSKYNVDILTLHEVISINPDEKSLEIKDLLIGEIFL